MKSEGKALTQAEADRREISVSAESAGERADVFLATSLAISRSAAQRLLEDGYVFLDGNSLTKRDRLRGGAVLLVEIPPPVDCEAKAQDIPLNIVYEDDDLLVVNKPKGMVVHPAAGNPDGTLVNALLAHCGESLSGIGGVLRPGIVHRLDKDTGGLLMVAKNDFAHVGLAEQIKEHSFLREYKAVIRGHLKQQSGVIEAPIGRHPSDRKKMAVTEQHSRPATTEYTVLQEFSGYSLVRLRLQTGRTHQIRVHMAYMGHPVAGDTVYGGAARPFEPHGQCLFAETVGFVHPRTGQYLQFTAPLPDWFITFLHRLESQ